MTKSYDSIIGNVICGLVDLRQFVEENEIPPFYIDQVREIQQKLETLDYYMAYGEEPTPSSTIAGVDFSDSLSQLETL